MGQLIRNGINYSGLIDAQGIFIDTDNIIQAQTSFLSSLSYTATEDCYITFYLVGAANQTTQILVNGALVYNDWQSDLKTYGTQLFVKKGQTVTVTDVDSTYPSSYTVYGIQLGSNVTLVADTAGAIYDTNEKEVGCWINGKPIYQKTIEIGTLPNTTSKTVNHNISNIEAVISYSCAFMDSTWGGPIPFLSMTGSSLSAAGCIAVSVGLTAITISAGSNRTTCTGYVTIRYTKTTDTAGSGRLVPSGMPSVQYDSTEKIVGTWFGSTLYEKTWDFANDLSISTPNSWTPTSISISANSISKVVKIVQAVSDVGTVWDNIGLATNIDDYVQLISSRNSGGIAIRYLTLQYTKSS